MLPYQTIDHGTADLLKKKDSYNFVSPSRLALDQSELKQYESEIVVERKGSVLAEIKNYKSLRGASDRIIRNPNSSGLLSLSQLDFNQLDHSVRLDTDTCPANDYKLVSENGRNGERMESSVSHHYSCGSLQPNAASSMSNLRPTKVPLNILRRLDIEESLQTQQSFL